MPQRALERRLHLHVAEFGDSEIEVLESGRTLDGIVLEEELRELEACESDLGAEAYFRTTSSA